MVHASVCKTGFGDGFLDLYVTEAQYGLHRVKRVRTMGNVIYNFGTGEGALSRHGGCW